MLNIIDMRLDKFFGDPDEKRVAKDTAGSVSGDDLNLKEILKKSGGFGTIFGAALVAYALDLDKYIRTAFAGKVIFKGLSAAFKSVFSIGPVQKALSGITKSLGVFFGNLNKALAPKNFVSLSKAVQYFMAPFKNIINGFRNIGKTVNAFGKTVTVTFKSLDFMGKIGATIKTIVRPIGAIFKTIGGVFTGIFKFLGPFIRIAGNFMKAIPIVGQVVMLLFGIFDFVKGFIKGFSEGGILGGLKEGAMELVRGFLTKPLDLLTKGIAYLMGFFGFDNIKASIDEFLQGGGITGLFNEAMAALGKAFDVVLQFFKDLFNDPIGTLKSAAENIGDFFVDIAKSIGNAISSMKDGLLEMLGLSGESSQAERGGGGGTSFSISEMFGDMDFSFLDPTTILSNIGENINNAFQALAESASKVKIVGSFLGGALASAGAGIGEMLGAENIQKFNVDTKEMDTLKGAAPRTASEGAAAGEMSKEVAAKKEAPSGPAVVDASTKSGDNVTNNNSKTEMAAAPVSSRPMHNPAAGRRRRRRR